MAAVSSESGDRALNMRHLGLLGGRGGGMGGASRQSSSASPPFLAAEPKGGFIDGPGKKSASGQAYAFLRSNSPEQQSYSPAIRASSLHQSPSARQMRSRHARGVIFAEENEQCLFHPDQSPEKSQIAEEFSTPEKEPVTPGPGVAKTPRSAVKQLRFVEDSTPLTPGGVASPTAIHLFQQFFTASPGFYERADRLKASEPPASPGGVGLAQRRPVLRNKTRLAVADGASAFASPGPVTPSTRRWSPNEKDTCAESPFVVRSQYGGSPVTSDNGDASPFVVRSQYGGDDASPFVVRSQFASPGEASPFVFRSACKESTAGSYYPGHRFTVEESPFAGRDDDTRKGRRHLLAEEGDDGVSFEMEGMFENRFIQAAKNAAGVGNASPASSSVCSLVIDYDSDEDELRENLDPQLQQDFEDRLAGPVFSVCKPQQGSRLENDESAQTQSNAQRRLFATPGRKKQPKTPRTRMKVGASRFALRSTRHVHGNLKAADDVLETPMGPLARVCEDRAHSGNSAEKEQPRREYRPPPKTRARPESARPMFRRCMSSNDRPFSAPREFKIPLDAEEHNTQDRPRLVPRRPSSQQGPPSAGGPRRRWQVSSSNGEIPNSTPEEVDALGRRAALRPPSSQQRPHSSMAAPTLGVFGRSVSATERSSHAMAVRMRAVGDASGSGGSFLPPIKKDAMAPREAWAAPAHTNKPAGGAVTKLPNINEKPDQNKRRSLF